MEVRDPMKQSIHVRRRRGLAILASVAIALAGLAALPTHAEASGSTTTKTFLVLYKPGASTSGAAKAIAASGGTVVANYSEIGVVLARSSKAGFVGAVTKTAGVEGAAATAAYATKIGDETADGPTPASTTSDFSDPLTGLQWDMTQINVPAAHAINDGDASVHVADLDTGLDFTHPDLAPVYDASRSTDCSSGTPSPLGVGNDQNGHGTHTAGTIAAAANGIGIVGVAPGVRIAGVKTSNDAGFFFPEMVICAYMWVATHDIDVTNNSYFADPWLYNCVNDPGQRAIWKAERRAIQYAESKGTVVVAAEGNESEDLSHPTTDLTSPDDTTPVERSITNACSTIPVEVPGVIGVTATGNLEQKAYYSSYGISTTDVAAPGGDRRFQVTAAAANGRVLSTWPDYLGCPIEVVDQGAHYCYLQGTSMASPHVAGLAALLQSAHGLTGGALAAAVTNATNPIACPTDYTNYLAFPGVNSGLPQVCEGGSTQNSWYGSGEVDALKAVS
jgi:lantibiotic leader peptide-processing serine protease